MVFVSWPYVGRAASQCSLIVWAECGWCVGGRSLRQTTSVAQYLCSVLVYVLSKGYSTCLTSNLGHRPHPHPHSNPPSNPRPFLLSLLVPSSTSAHVFFFSLSLFFFSFQNIFEEYLRGRHFCLSKENSINGSYSCMQYREFDKMK